jgi:hypothetical protein
VAPFEPRDGSLVCDLEKLSAGHRTVIDEASRDYGVRSVAQNTSIVKWSDTPEAGSCLTSEHRTRVEHTG